MTTETVRTELYGCDLIMKGGISSGVIYPPAIAELSKTHRFHSIAGSSAGALGAVAAAAAEYARQTGNEDAFDPLGGSDDTVSLNELLAEVDGSGKTLLHRLFVPQESTKPYFDLLWTLARSERKSLPVLQAVASHSSVVPSTLMGAAGLVLVLAAVVLPFTGSDSVVLGIVAGMMAVVGLALWLGSALTGGAKRLASTLHQSFIDNHFGFVNGSKVGDQEGVTSWLHLQIQRLAKSGRDRSSKPLTYGDLDAHGIELVTMTTNASQGSSDAFPFVDEDAWAFDPEDLKRLLPEDVFDYLVTTAKQHAEDWKSAELRPPQNLLPLPPATQLPVLLGARLSFPIPPALSAFPLYRRVSAPTNGAVDVTESQYVKIWLTDGGLCSNLPVHLFDAALPSRPTFAINLAYGTHPPDIANDDEMMRAHRLVSRPLSAEVGMDLPVHDISNMTSFGKSVLEASRNWSDNSTQSEVGVRDRICTVQLGDGEGGSNIDMSSDTIRDLAFRGRAAGENLAWMTTGIAPESDPTRGNDVPNTQWLRHRWTRLLTTIDGLAVFADKLATRYVSEEIVPQGGIEPEAITYADLTKNALTLKTALRLETTRWNEKTATDVEAIVDHLAKTPIEGTSLDVTDSERKLVLSTRKPTRSIPERDRPVDPFPT